MTLAIFVGIVIITGALVYLLSGKIKTYHKYVSTFSAALVASLIFIHILPEVYNADLKIKWLGLGLLGGLILQLILEKVTHGVGHDHDHNHAHSHAKSHKSILIGVMFGLGMHAMIESMPLLLNEDEHSAHHHEEVVDGGHHHDQETSVDEHHHHEHVHIEISNDKSDWSTKFFMAVLMHKVPVTVMLSLFLLSIGVSRWQYFILITFFALMVPIGAYLGLVLSDVPAFNKVEWMLVAISTGMLLHIITSILFEHGHSKKENNIHISLIIIGIIIGLFLF